MAQVGLKSIVSGVSIVCGTAIGTGILGIPTITAEAGFYPTILTFVICWLFTLISAFYLLEAHLWFRDESDFISLSGELLGQYGQKLTWGIYLTLLYSLICLYMLAGSALFAKISFEIVGLNISTLQSVLIFCTLPILFLSFEKIFFERINKWLIIILFLSFIIIVGATIPDIKSDYLVVGDGFATFKTMPVLITAFGYSIIIPALSSHCEYNVKRLVKIIIIGSIITLLIYLLWELVALGSIGFDSLMDLSKLHDDGSGVIRGLAGNGRKFITPILTVFAGAAIITSIFGVSLALYHFLSDGLKMVRPNKKQHVLLLLLIFIPSIMIITFYPAGFQKVLSWAGVIVAILLGIIPALMVWVGRYYLNKKGFKVFGGRKMLFACLFFNLFVVVQQFI